MAINRKFHDDYRVVKRVGDRTNTYTVNRVWYSDDGPEGLHLVSTGPHGDSRNSFLADLDEILKAFAKPVLIYDVELDMFIGKENRLCTTELEALLAIDLKEDQS